MGTDVEARVRTCCICGDFHTELTLDLLLLLMIIRSGQLRRAMDSFFSALDGLWAGQCCLIALCNISNHCSNHSSPSCIQVRTAASTDWPKLRHYRETFRAHGSPRRLSIERAGSTKHLTAPSRDLMASHKLSSLRIHGLGNYAVRWTPSFLPWTVFGLVNVA
jgi:hypothetical protein